MKTLPFDNRFVAELPGELSGSLERRQVTGALWCPVPTTPVRAPRLLAHSPEVAALLGLSPDDVASPLFTEVMGGNALADGMAPWATVYGGHQFGNWAGQLGDGRAISLGEALGADGGRWELQLKGAGPTPFSRTADGRAVLRSSIREFLCSEAMHNLGIPTTRALSLVGTGEAVVRDMLYDGNPRPEPGAIVCRVAPSFTRFGHFELPTSRGDHALLEQLVDFTVARDFPELGEELQGAGGMELRTRWFREVCERTARMVIGWMRVGFVHGVMNTDNMSILGLTIDYGPYGWLDPFDPDWTPNTTDLRERRYRFGQQPAVAQWNLMRLAHALLPLFPDPAPLEEGLEAYRELFLTGHTAMNGAKFGFRAVSEREEAVIREGFELLARRAVDHTLFFRTLGEVAGGLAEESPPTAAPFRPALYPEGDSPDREAALSAWLGRWSSAILAQGVPGAAVREAMHRINPLHILRNYLVHEAIQKAEEGDAGGVVTLLELARRPYDDRPEFAHLAVRRPDWARQKAGCSMLSCSS